MSDTYRQDVTNIDQPAELEGVRLNWRRSKFVETCNGPRDLRTAPATPEFWEVWKRNKEALKAAGITCTRNTEGNWCVQWWIDVSGDGTDVTLVDDIDIPEDESYTLSSGDVTPTESICIPQDESYTLSEVIDFVKQTLDGVSERSVQNELRYSATDLYWLLHDMLRYVSQNVSGVFVLRQIQKDTYRVKHMAEDFAKQRSDRKLKVEVNRTAKYLEELTGRKPSWSEKE